MFGVIDQGISNHLCRRYLAQESNFARSFVGSHALVETSNCRTSTITCAEITPPGIHVRTKDVVKRDLSNKVCGEIIAYRLITPLAVDRCAKLAPMLVRGANAVRT